MIIKPIIYYLLILILSLQACNNYQTEKNCCELADNEFEYDIQCKNFKKSYCYQIGKMVNMHPGSSISFSKYKNLDKSYQDTSFQTIIEDGKGVIQRDTTIFYRTLYSEDFFTYEPVSYNFSNKLEISMKKNYIEFRYLGKSRRVEYDSFNKSNVYNALQFLENTKD